MTGPDPKDVVLLPLDRLLTSHIEQGALSQLHLWLYANSNGAVAEDILADVLDEEATVIWAGEVLAKGSNLVAALARDGSGTPRILESGVPVIASEAGDPFVIRVPVLVGREGDGQAVQLEATFVESDGLEPRLTRLDYQAVSRATDTPYPAWTSRVFSLLHRWHALVEDPNRSAPPFAEIISDPFAMEYGYGAVRSFEELAQWVSGSASSVAAARHDIARFEASREGENIRAGFILDWQGLSHQEKRMVAQSKHNWIIEDNPDQRFPKVGHITVEFPMPFATLD